MNELAKFLHGTLRLESAAPNAKEAVSQPTANIITEDENKAIGHGFRQAINDSTRFDLGGTDAAGSSGATPPILAPSSRRSSRSTPAGTILSMIPDAAPRIPDE